MRARDILRPQHPAVGYLTAFLMVAIIGLIHVSILYPAQTTDEFTPFYIAVIAAALYGGLGPGLFAVVLSVLASTLFLLDGRSLDNAGIVSLVQFAIVGTLITLLSVSKNKAEADLVQETDRVLEQDRELRAVHDRNSHILASISDAFAGFDRNWRFIFANEAASRFTGVPSRELIGKTLWEVPSELAKQEVRRECEQAIEQAKPCTLEVFDDRHKLWFEVKVYPATWGATLYALDVTDRKWAETKEVLLGDVSHTLSASLDYHASLQLLAEHVVPRFADWCTIHMVEDGHLQQLVVAHRDPEKAKWARRLQERYPPDMDAPTGVANVVRTGKPEFYPEITPEMLEGAARDASHLQVIKELGFTSAMMVPLISSEQVLGCLTVVSAESNRHYSPSDLKFLEELAARAALAVDNARLYTQARNELESRKRAEEELTQLNQELEKRVDSRTTELRAAVDDLEGFCYSVSHDLRAPMRSIAGNSQILLEDYSEQLDEEGRRNLVRLANASTKMGQLIDDLLRFSRLGRTEMKKRYIDLSQVAASVVAELWASYPEDKNHVHIQPQLMVEADPLLIGVVLQNLIENAFKYRSPDREAFVDVGSTERDGRTVYFVRDNGIGFNPEYADRIFQPFERLHRDTEIPGTGIGLANVRRIINRHGGQIWADSEPGTGTTFNFTLGEFEPAASERTAPYLS